MKDLLLFCALAMALVGCTGPTKTSTDVLPAAPVDSFAMRLAEVGERITQAPNDAALYAERAALLQSRDSIMPAMNDLVRAVKLDSTNATYRLRLGELMWFTRQVDQANYQYEKALALEPNNAEAMLKLAEIQLVLRQYQKCMDLTNSALRIDARSAKGYFLKGWVHKETGDTTKAISSFHTAVEMDPDHYDALIQLGLMHAHRREVLALDFYNSALTIRPRSTEALYNKAMFAQENGMDSLALACYAQMMETDPNNALAYYNTGFIQLEHLDEPSLAVKSFTGAIERLPTYHQAYFNRGLAYERLQRKDSASVDYRRALALFPEYDLAARGLDRVTK